MLAWRRDGADPALPRGAVRRGHGRPARDARRAAVRRPRRAARAELLARSPYNVVHLTLPESEDEAARDVARLAASRASSSGTRRRRSGRSCRTTSAPTASRARAPGSSPRCASSRTRRARCCRTSARTAARRRAACGCVRATGVQLEPIFLLYDGAAPFAVPDREPDLEVEGARLWRLDDDLAELLRRPAAPDRGRPPPLRDGRRLPRAGGHARRARSCRSCSSRRRIPASTIFPTHRVFSGRRRALERLVVRRGRGAGRARARAGRPRRLRRVRRRRARRRSRAPGTLAVQVVDELGHEGLAYTPDAEEAVRRVDDGRGVGRVPAPADADRGRLRRRAAGRGAPAEDDVLLPQAPLRAALPPA